MKLPVLNILGEAMLASSDKPINCDADDLANVLIVFIAIAHSLSWKHYTDFTIEQKMMLAEEFGSNIRQSVMLFTGIDPHDAVTGNAEWADEIE